jgi:hypothetical protein
MNKGRIKTVLLIVVIILLALILFGLLAALQSFKNSANSQQSTLVVHMILFKSAIITIIFNNKYV